MHKVFLQTSALIGAVAVAFGAFGAHALKKMVSDVTLNVFETAVRYQFYHVFALAIVAMVYRDYPGKWLIWSGNLFITGIILFSGSLYLLTYFKATAKSNFEWVGAITPFGGLAFIAGWVCLLVGLYKSTVA
jgi:uncharacterized membrane protein YgdD (TMEM256/DUF423 family)